ncbi:hypothetical protein B0T16DRAFT_95394 [Cercophora newfieldiana]|uniref:Secreted protein n=1 Tax=Cercophora newfieldiana TaxID=92897 RepID=A0AA39YJI7_9PEZI|nr:hypothetical protein B0T16DRAFT_95394 [Cercophora newfieldiana]
MGLRRHTLRLRLLSLLGTSGLSSTRYLDTAATGPSSLEISRVLPFLAAHVSQSPSRPSPPPFVPLFRLPQCCPQGSLRLVVRQTRQETLNGPWQTETDEQTMSASTSGGWRCGVVQ